MKEFFKYVLATITGIVVISIIGFVFLLMIIGAIVASTEKQVTVENNSMLVIDMSHRLVDRARNDPFEDLNIPGLSVVKSLGLDDIATSLENAVNDDRIKGVYLKLSVTNGDGFGGRDQKYAERV